jgi:hypothetical protein
VVGGTEDVLLSIWPMKREEGAAGEITYSGDEEVWYQAAEEGILDKLQEIRHQMEPDFPWDDRTCYLAARWGHLHVLEWLYSLNLSCVTDEETWYLALEGGNLDLIMWLKERGCVYLTERSCLVATEANNVELLQWLRSQNPPCPWNRSECLSLAREFENGEVLEWIESCD